MHSVMSPGNRFSANGREDNTDHLQIRRSKSSRDAKDRRSDLSETDLLKFTSDLIRSKLLKKSFYVFNTTHASRLYAVWKERLPRVRPFYAVKCNTNEKLIRLLHRLGAGFDCASEAEMKLVMQQGVPPSDIIFANPCKDPEELVFSQQMGIDLSTVDSVCELKKIKRWTPNGRVLIRIRADDKTAKFILGTKFGAEMDELPGLYTEAKALGIRVMGIAFHIGCCAKNPEAYADAIALARRAFDLGTEFGFQMTILDIGGGFVSADADGTMSVFRSMTAAIDRSLDLHFPIDSGIKIVAEPGTYFAETCFTLVANIIGFRERKIDGARRRDYWLSDGVYGSFHPFCAHSPMPVPLRMHKTEPDGHETMGTLYGPTCDAVDVVAKDVKLPEMVVGDWLVFKKMGAYTSVLKTTFNGMHGGFKTFSFSIVDV